MSIRLRDYQENIINETRDLMKKGNRSILICSPTGSGKTALTAHMLKTAAQKNMRSFFIVHRRELIMQSLYAFKKIDVKAGVISNGFPESYDHKIQVASVQSLARRLKKYSRPKLIIWDECHHIAAGTWESIFNYYPDAFHIGLTATPERLDGKGLNKFFKTMVRGPSVSWLIENKYLSDYRAYAPSTVDISGVKKTMGDFNKTQLDTLMDAPTITGCAVREYKKTAMGKRAVVFCVSIKHSEHVADEFNAAGISAASLDGTKHRQLREDTLKKFAEGKIKVLCNVDLFGEGFDLPSIEATILLRPTQSLSLYLQQVGRSLRPLEGKSHAIILDHVGNVMRHGFPDEERNWSLLGKAERLKGQKEKAPGIKTCKNCFSALPAFVDICKYCKTPIKKQSREIQEVDGELKEIDKSTLKRKQMREQGSAQSLEDLYQVGLKRGYKHARRWAQHIFQARQAKRNKQL